MPTPDEVQADERARMTAIYAQEREARRKETGPADRAARTRETGHSVSLPEDAVPVGSDPLRLASPQSLAPGAVPAQAGLMPPDVRAGADWLSMMASLPPLPPGQVVL